MITTLDYNCVQFLHLYYNLSLLVYSGTVTSNIPLFFHPEKQSKFVCVCVCVCVCSIWFPQKDEQIIEPNKYTSSVKCCRSRCVPWLLLTMSYYRCVTEKTETYFCLPSINLSLIILWLRGPYNASFSL
jgi:hypothetical protein